MKTRSILALLTIPLAVPVLTLHADDKTEFSNVALPPGLVAPETRPGTAATVCFLEGPAVDEHGNRLLQRHRRQSHPQDDP